MDRDAFARSLARRLVDHVQNGTTDLCEEVLELPLGIYSDERQAEELDVLFLQAPLVLALSGALPKPGSYRAVDLLGTPLLLTRDKEGKVRSFLNACRHRAVRLVDGAAERGRIRCPFHAWTYDLEGALTHVPTPSGFEGMCREDKGLVELPVTEGYGLIVGRLRPGAPVDIDEYLGPGLADELAMLDFADWTLHGEPHVHKVGGNWKVTLDTFRENYHFNVLHKDTLAAYAYGGHLTFDAFGPHLRNCSAVRTIDVLKDAVESEWSDVEPHLSYQYALFPNTNLTFDARHIEMWQVLPVDATTSEVVHTTYLRPGLSPAEHAKAVDMAPWICDVVVDGEDFWVAGRTEPAVRNDLLGTIVFGRNEPAPQHLHRGFEAALEAARLRRAGQG